MVRGLFAATSGMMAQLAKQDVIANNLANINTPGFRRDVVGIQAFPLVMMNASAQKEDSKEIGNLRSGSMVSSEVAIDFAPGTLIDTGNTTDLALSGDGFFVVQTPAGQAYTRKGAFHLDSNRQLVTSEGYPVLGEKGPITVAGKSWSVESDGRVLVDKKEVDVLKVVDFPKPYRLQKTAQGFLESADAPVKSTNASFHQGSLEAANVNAVQEMVQMITTFRNYEANQKVIQAVDQTTERALQMAKV